jgi:hypothetical protein
MSKNSNYCSIDINNKESYSGMCTTGILGINVKFSDDIKSLNEPQICGENMDKVTFSAASNYKPRWEMRNEK